MELFMRYPDGKKKALTFSYDDGVEQDIRLTALMDQYGIKGTFNINSGLFTPEGTVFPEGQIHRRMTKSQVLNLWKDTPHEIAAHTLTHPFLGKIRYECAMSEILEDRRNLEEMFEYPVRGMVYPYIGYTDDIVDSLKKAHFLYSRTDDNTYGFALAENPLTLTPTCHHDDLEDLSLAKKFLEGEVGQFDDPYLFFIWGHSYEFDQKDNWHVIENFFKFIAHKEDVWYATNGEIYSYIEKWNRMEFTLSGRFAQNPTDTDLYMLYNNRELMIKSGEIKKLSLV
jgi:Predicted xylanase/chitin deacetylase